MINVGCRLAVMACFAASASGVWADVVVIANRTRTAAGLSVRQQGIASHRYLIPPNDVLHIPSRGGLSVDIQSDRRAAIRYGLDANSAYFLGAATNGSVTLTKIGLGGDSQTSDGRPLAGTGPGSGPATITVKILVDDDEPATQKVWEKRLRRRVGNASSVLEKYAAVRLRVVAVGTWTSDNKINDFGRSLVEFERQVSPAPARLAIGFTSQYQIPRGRTHLGGTRGPLRSHILIREWSQHLPERQQRLELLLHELGHFLGAVHSPEPDSVMRPVLSSGKPRSAPLRFDPVNTLVMYLVGEEIRAVGRDTGRFDRSHPRSPSADLCDHGSSHTRRPDGAEIRRLLGQKWTATGHRLAAQKEGQSARRGDAPSDHRDCRRCPGESPRRGARDDVDRPARARIDRRPDAVLCSPRGPGRWPTALQPRPKRAGLGFGDRAGRFGSPAGPPQDPSVRRRGRTGWPTPQSRVRRWPADHPGPT